MYDRLVHDSRSITCPLRVCPLSPRIAFRYVAALARVLLGVRFMFVRLDVPLGVRFVCVRLIHGSRSVMCPLHVADSARVLFWIWPT